MSFIEQTSTMMKGSNDAGDGDGPTDWQLDEVNIEAPVDTSDSNHSMPAVEEVITEACAGGFTKQRTRKKWLVGVIAALVVLVVAIPSAIIASNSSSSAASTVPTNEGPIDKVAGGANEKDADADINHTDRDKQNDDGAKDSDTDLDHTTNDQADTSNARMSTFPEIVENLVSEDVSHRSDLESDDTPQQRAALWMADLDKYNLPVPTSGREDLGDGYKYGEFASAWECSFVAVPFSHDKRSFLYFA